MTDPINIADEYEKRERKRVEAWAKAFNPLPVPQESALNKLLASAPYFILYYGPDALKKAEKYLRDNDITFPLMGTIFKLFYWGFSWMRNRAKIK